jgi:hypothetical protein
VQQPFLQTVAFSIWEKPQITAVETEHTHTHCVSQAGSERAVMVVSVVKQKNIPIYVFLHIKRGREVDKRQTVTEWWEKFVCS